MLGNLVSNVLGYTPQETVADIGPGVAEEERRHVFERFFRSDASRSGITAGAGLGRSRFKPGGLRPG